MVIAHPGSSMTTTTANGLATSAAEHSWSGTEIPRRFVVVVVVVIVVVIEHSAKTIMTTTTTTTTTTITTGDCLGTSAPRH
jgi:hypothetical protein